MSFSKSFSQAIIFGALSSSLLFVQPAHARRLSGVCSWILQTVNEEKLLMEKGPQAKKLYIDIFFNNAFHKSTEINIKAFEIFSEPGVDQTILNEIKSKPQVFRKVAIEKLSSLSKADRAEILGSVDDFREWVKDEALDSWQEGYIQVGDGFIEKSLYNKLLVAQKNIEKLGIQTEIVPFKISRKVGRGALAITQIQNNFQLPLTPLTPVILTQEFNTAFKEAQSSNGLILIDPFPGMLLQAAYFGKGYVKGSNWVVGIKPTATGSAFIHEMTHKADLLDVAPEVFLNPVPPKDRQGLISRSLYITGGRLEAAFKSELNATDNQINLARSAGAYPGAFDIVNTILYKSIAERRVAIGRILMNPKDPTHYLLYLKSRAIFYGAFYGAMKTGSLPLFTAYAIERLITKIQLDLHMSGLSAGVEILHVVPSSTSH